MAPTTAVRLLVRRGPVFQRVASRPMGARQKSTKPNNGQPLADPEPKNITIPGSSWMWLEPVSKPFRAYGRAQARRPYVVQLLSTITVQHPATSMPLPY